MLPPDVRQVMQLVASHGVGDGADAADGPVRGGAALPGRRVETAQERDERGARRHELGHDIAERALPVVGRRRVAFDALRASACGGVRVARKAGLSVI